MKNLKNDGLLDFDDEEQKRIADNPPANAYILK